MTTLHALGLTPSHLTPAAQRLILAIRGNSCAWRRHGRWSPKRPGFPDSQKRTGDVLVGYRLAQVLSGKGSLRLVLTGAGEEMADLLHKQKSRSAA